MSVSRRAGPPQRGQVVATNSGSRASGELTVVGRLVVVELGQQHGQLLGGHGHDAAGVAVDDRDGHAPVALPADQPVAQLEVDLGPGQAALGEAGDDRGEGLARRRETVELAGVDHDAVTGVGLGQRALGAARRRDDLENGKPERGGEGEVALVVGRHGHDGAGAVAHQHVVADPDGDALAVYRVHGVGAGEDAGLLLLGGEAFDLALAARLVLVGGDRGALLFGRELGDQRMLRREHHVGGAEERVGPRREDGQRVAAPGQGELDLGALGAPDPVGLHAA